MAPVSDQSRRHFFISRRLVRVGNKKKKTHTHSHTHPHTHTHARTHAHTHARTHTHTHTHAHIRTHTHNTFLVNWSESLNWKNQTRVSLIWESLNCQILTARVSQHPHLPLFSHTPIQSHPNSVKPLFSHTPVFATCFLGHPRMFGPLFPFLCAGIFSMKGCCRAPVAPLLRALLPQRRSSHAPPMFASSTWAKMASAV